MKNFLRRKSRIEDEKATHRQQLMRAIGNLDPFADADPQEVEERLRRISHGTTNPAVIANR